MKIQIKFPFIYFLFDFIHSNTPTLEFTIFFQNWLTKQYPPIDNVSIETFILLEIEWIIYYTKHIFYSNTKRMWKGISLIAFISTCINFSAMLQWIARGNFKKNWNDAKNQVGVEVNFKGIKELSKIDETWVRIPKKNSFLIKPVCFFFLNFEKQFLILQCCCLKMDQGKEYLWWKIFNRLRLLTIHDDFLFSRWNKEFWFW
jgi:hypothetical protein